jgi:membrane-bound lytic murein transglycosylase A
MRPILLLISAGLGSLPLFQSISPQSVSQPPQSVSQPKASQPKASQPKASAGIATVQKIGFANATSLFTTAAPIAQSNVAQTNSQPSTPVLRKIDPAILNTTFGVDHQLWESANQPGDKQALFRAIAYSLDYLATPAAATAYQNYAIRDFSRDRVQRSLERFQQLVETSRTPQALRTAVLREFDIYQSVGTDGQGDVHFTGYFEPTYQASRTQTATYRYPIYRVPSNLSTWRKPHPTRSQLEGADGLQGGRGQLSGLEIAWLGDRFEAFLAQVQGSAKLQLTDGSTISISYAGRTDHPYVSIGRELVTDGKMRLEEVTMQSLIAYFKQRPSELSEYLPRNDRFVFFREVDGTGAIGTFQVPVTAERSIATDKSIMPPCALALIQTEIPDRQLNPQRVHRYVLNQDTGGAIKGAGRVDIFMGSGQVAGERAGVLNATGALYYLLLK